MSSCSRQDLEGNVEKACNYVTASSAEESSGPKGHQGRSIAEQKQAVVAQSQKFC